MPSARRIGLLAATTALVVLSPATPAATPAGKLVAGGDDGIYVLNADGTGLSRITHACCGGSDDDPRWSPDGAWIAFERSSKRQGVYVVRSDGAGLRRVMDEVSSFEWSPDGRRLAFERGDGVGVVDVRSGARRTLPVGDGPPGVAWSPDGRRLAFGGADRITLWNVATAERTAIAVDGELVPSLLAWSPDGRRLAFVDRPDENDFLAQHRLFVVAAAGGPATELADRLQSVTPAWSPDGRRIAYVRSDGIYVADVAAGKARRVVAGSYVDDELGAAPRWSPDGAFLAFTRARVRDSFLGSDVWVVGGDGSGARPLTRAFPTGVGYSGPDWGSGSVPARSGPSRATARLRPAAAYVVAESVDMLASDGVRAVFSTVSCNTVGSWAPPSPARLGEATCGDAEATSELAAGAGLAAWSYSQQTNTTDFSELLAGAPGGRPVDIRTAEHERDEHLGNLAGDGSLLVFQTWRGDGRDVGLWRLVRGSRPSARLVRTDDETYAVADVDSGRIAVRAPGGRLRILAASGRVLRELRVVAPGEARIVLHGWQVAFARGGTLAVYDARTDELLHRRRLVVAAGKPSLEDVARGLAVYASGLELHLLRLADGRDNILELANAVGPLHARFGDRGLFVSYNRAYVARPGRVVLFPWSALRRAFVTGSGTVTDAPRR